MHLKSAQTIYLQPRKNLKIGKNPKAAILNEEILWPSWLSGPLQREQTPPRPITFTPKYTWDKLEYTKIFPRFQILPESFKNNPIKHKTYSHFLETLIIWQFLLREGMREGGKTWKDRARWRNWGLEVLHPRETRSETGTLLWWEQRRVTLSLLCGLQELSGRWGPGSQAAQSSGSPPCTGTEKGHSVQQKKPPGSGFTFSWSWLGLSTLCSFARFCAASR